MSAVLSGLFLIALPLRADAATNAVLDTRSVSSFVNGEYVVWNISGHVTIHVACTGGPNAVVSGIFFGPVP